MGYLITGGSNDVAYPHVAIVHAGAAVGGATARMGKTGEEEREMNCERCVGGMALDPINTYTKTVGGQMLTLCFYHWSQHAETLCARVDELEALPLDDTPAEGKKCENCGWYNDDIQECVEPEPKPGEEPCHTIVNEDGTRTYTNWIPRDPAPQPEGEGSQD